jgi:hypothetical protein
LYTFLNYSMCDTSSADLILLDLVPSPKKYTKYFIPNLRVHWMLHICPEFIRTKCNHKLLTSNMTCTGDKSNPLNCMWKWSKLLSQRLSGAETDPQTSQDKHTFLTKRN